MSFPLDFSGLKKLYLPQVLPEASSQHLSGRTGENSTRVNWSSQFLWYVTIVPEVGTA